MESIELLENLKKSVNSLGLDLSMLMEDDFNCNSNISWKAFNSVINTGKKLEFIELMAEINNIKNIDRKQSNFIKNINDVFNFCNIKNNEYTEIKISLNKMRNELDEINQRRNIEFLSLENFELIQKSFFEGNPLVSTLFEELSSINLGIICKLKNEISIEMKLFA